MAGGTLAYATQRAPVPWWSFTKTAIAAAILTLVRDGELELDAPFEGRGFSLRLLLQHRAGIANYGGLPAYHAAVAAGEAPWSAEELLERCQADALLFAPGTGFAYSNIGYLMLRRMLEQVCDCPLGDALRLLVLAPLDIEATLLSEKLPPGRTMSGLRAGYDPGWVYHGLLCGPLDQAALLLRRLMSGDFLPASLREEMCAGVGVGPAMPDRPFRQPAYGLGTMVDLAAGFVGHTGGGPDSAIAVYFSPATQRAAAVFGPSDAADAVETRAATLILDDGEANE
ncbi:MAG: serine hydrolase domain-containing protein [Reyranellaceae bacterium]